MQDTQPVAALHEAVKDSMPGYKSRKAHDTVSASQSVAELTVRTVIEIANPHLWLDRQEIGKLIWDVIPGDDAHDIHAPRS